MLVQQGYKYRVEPTPVQRQALERTAGVTRFIWNCALALQKHRLERGGRLLNYAELCKELTAARKTPGLEFLAKAHSQASQQTLKDLCRAFRDFFAGAKGFSVC